MISRPRTILALAATAMFVSASEAHAGTITAQGNVAALTDVAQLQGIVGTASFDEADTGTIPLDQYTPLGMTFHTGPLSAIVPGVATVGSAVQPSYQVIGAYFPDPIAGGAISEEAFAFKGGAVTFTMPITQFGLTASNNGKQYITAWDGNGAMIGQVTWTPNGDAAFVGIDTQGVPIGLLTYGNDNLFAGATYDIGGLSIYSDTWIWAGIPCQADAECEVDRDVCTDDLCLDEVCQHPLNTAACDDADACTAMDQCNAGECLGAPVDCDDDDPCTVEQCDVALGCVIEAMPGCCTSDRECMPGEICQLGSNSCIPDPGGDETTTTDDGESTSGESSTSDEGSTGEEDSTGDTGESSTLGDDEIGDDASTLDTFGGGESTDGCGCSAAPPRGLGSGWCGLALLAGIRRRREP
ncbi:hypothetical protein ACNOYE_02615 [Nannocystaceae bacterium ST9]